MGWQILFLVEAVPAFVFGLVLFFWLADWPKEVSWLSDDEKSRLAREYESDLLRKKAVRSYSFWQALRDREVLKLCLIYFLWITGYWGFNFWMPTVLQEVSGWSTLKVGWTIAIPMSFSLAAMVFVAYSSSRSGEKRWHGAVPMFVASAGMGIGTFIHDPLWNLVFVCLSAIGVFGAFGVWWSYPTSFLSGVAAAGAVGFINSVGNTGGYLGPYLTGFIKDLTGSYHAAYVLFAIFLFAAGLLMLTLAKDQRKVIVV